MNTQGHDSPNTVRFLRLPQLQNRVSLGKSAIYAAVKAGTFPAPIKLGARAVAWDSASVDRWCAERIQASHKA
jgi:prophage regulatory protein